MNAERPISCAATNSASLLLQHCCLCRELFCFVQEISLSRDFGRGARFGLCFAGAAEISLLYGLKATQSCERPQKGKDRSGQHLYSKGCATESRNS